MSDDPQASPHPRGEPLPDDDTAAARLFAQLGGGLAFDRIDERWEEAGGIESGRLVLRLAPLDVERCAFGVLFLLAGLSFRDALPAGNSRRDYRFQDGFTVADLLEHLRFERGHLHFHADYVRGRLMKTTLDLAPDGLLVVATLNRGRLAARWVEMLGRLALAAGDGPGD